MSVLFNCLAATRLISKSQHVDLSFKDNLSLNIHIAICKYCKSFQKDLELIKIELEQMDKTNIQSMNPTFKKELTVKLIAELNREEE